MTCREFAEFIADYLATELPPEVGARFDEHLAVCPNCQRYLRSYEDTIKLGKAAFSTDDVPLPEEVPEQLIHAILQSRQKA